MQEVMFPDKADRRSPPTRELKAVGFWLVRRNADANSAESKDRVDTDSIGRHSGRRARADCPR